MNNILRRSTCLFLSIFCSLLTYAQAITGVWNGSLHVQPKDIPIVFHIGIDSSGKLIAAFDSPTQNAFGLPVSEVITKEDSVILMIAILGGKYAGVFGGDKKTINGMWYQGKGSLPLTITKTSDSATVKQQRRPQTPRPPFPYQVRNVEYWNSDKSISFGGTLTYPMEESQVTTAASSGKKGYPAVILITGSGPRDRDEMLLGHKPFAVIADNLTRRGFVVLRVDDRG